MRSLSRALAALTAALALGAPAQAVEFRSIALSVSDLIFDPAGGRLLASVPSLRQPFGEALPRPIANSILPIDPRDGTLGAPVFVGSEPNRLARSDDGSALYVGLDGAFAVRRLSLPGLVPGLQFPLGHSTGPHRVEDMVIQPGQPDVVAVAERIVSGSPQSRGVTIYDDGVARPLRAIAHTNRIEFAGDADRLYAYENEVSSFAFHTIEIDELGATIAESTEGVLVGFSLDLDSAAGRITASNGMTVDPTGPVLLGTYESPFFGHRRDVVADPAANLVYFLTDTNLWVYDLATFVFLGFVPLPDDSGSPRDLVQWGEGALAYHTDRVVYFFELDPPDRDGDGVGDGKDNCPLESNPDQTDTDADHTGDACDPRVAIPDGALAQCEQELAASWEAVSACGQSYDPIDDDVDGEHDHNDRCPDTPDGVPVDDSGCSLAQFCPTQGAGCANADWRNDEPGAKPGDCVLLGKKKTGTCVPAAAP